MNAQLQLDITCLFLMESLTFWLRFLRCYSFQLIQESTCKQKDFNMPKLTTRTIRFYYWQEISEELRRKKTREGGVNYHKLFLPFVSLKTVDFFYLNLGWFIQTFPSYCHLLNIPKNNLPVKKWPVLYMQKRFAYKNACIQKF